MSSVCGVARAAGRGFLSPAGFLLAALLTLAPALPALGQINNTVTVTGDYNGAPVTAQASESVSVVPAAPAMVLTKTGTLNDDDGVPGVSAGDTIGWTVTAENTGNVTLTNPVFSDPGIPLTVVSGDDANPGLLDPGETWTLTGSSALTQTDIDGNGGGDGDIDNTVTVTTDQLPPQTASASVPFLAPGRLVLEKRLVSLVQVFPGVFDVEFAIAARNSGPVTLGPIAISDDLASAFSPGTIAGAPVVSLSGFSGAGGADPAYDGVVSTGLLQGPVELPPGASGEVRIRARIDTGLADMDGVNVAVATAPQLTAPVSSNDPLTTPEIADDVQPTPVSLTDTDGDGATDGVESASADRDGDGVADASDYDPTGYFYCQSDGSILPGGLVTVTNLGTGGSQVGVGASNDITIVRDGSDGFYQFHVTAPGLYRLTYALPPGGVASTDRLPRPALDVTSYLPANPAVIGSSETGATGRLADFSAGANPFHVEFDIEAGDPSVFNNNIPLELCGEPRLAVAKAVAEGPALQASGQSRVVYAIDVTATGTEAVEDVTVTDDLEAVFGAGNFTVAGVTLASAPPAFGAAANPAFDGSANAALLTAGGDLEPGDRLEIEVEVLLGAPAGVYDNLVTAGGVSPVDGAPVPDATAVATTLLVTASGAQDLVASKTASPSVVQRGQQIAYTIQIENTLGADRNGVDIVDQLPAGLTYVPGSARIGGTATEPFASGRELAWRNLTIPANGTVTVTLNLLAGAAANAAEFTNSAYARDPVSGLAVSNVATATVRLRFEPVFDCSDIIGRVYEDRNRDGYMQDGEPGVAGVRLATVRGLLVTTDQFGRFHVACADIPDAEIGSNFIMKLDERTLPAGWRVTSENPRVIRITRGRMSSLDFGVAGGRLVEFEVDARSFEDGRTTLKPVALSAINQLLGDLQEPGSTLRITYRGGAADALATDRLELLSALVRAAHDARNPGSALQVETRLAQ